MHPQSAESTTIPKTPLRFVYFIARQHAGFGIVAILLVTLAQLCQVFLPFVLKNIIDISSSPDAQNADVFWWVFSFPILMLLMYCFYRLSGFVGMVWLVRSENLSYRILFEYMTRHSHAYFSDRFAGSLGGKISHAADGTFRLLDSTLWGHYGAVLSLISSGVLIFMTHFWVGVVYVALILILIPVNYYIARYRRPHVVSYSSQVTALRGKTVDVITNISAVRQFSRKTYEHKNIDDALDLVARLDLKQWRISEWALLFNNVIIFAAISMMLGIMYHLWTAEMVTSGDFVLVVSLILSLSSTLVFIGSAMNQFIRLYGEVEEGLNEILLPQEIVDRPDAIQFKGGKGEIVWNDVSFKYENRPVFENFDLTIAPGQRVGLVGQSGAGKTTFVSLLLRQHDIQGGVISIDGQDIAGVTQDSLREHIAVVPQEPMLFHRSIRENIAYGKPDATEEEIIEVAKKAEAHDFIASLPKGYDTLVGERGVKLSGGQKQRIAIARAMLKNAPILILDEATSALDSESEVAIQKALHELMAGKTVVAIAHRLSTLREMDRIIVLEKGKIIEDGRHDELVKRKGLYSRLWEHQAGGFLTE